MSKMFLEIKGKPRRIPLETGQLYLLGKKRNGIKEIPRNYIHLEEDDTDERHCVIEISLKEEVFVYDLFSLKGTFLDNKPLNSLEKTRLKTGVVLKLGNNEIKYFDDSHEVSRDSSGFQDVKNSSDITSSPEQLENHMKFKNNDFLIPSIPSKKSMTPQSNNSSNFLNDSNTSNNRRSDSFTIPETQHCGPQNSTSNASDLSIAESINDDNSGKIKFNFGNPDSFVDDDDDLCIPETQEVLAIDCMSSNQRPQLLSNGRSQFKENTIFEEEPSKLENNVEDSQFRITTQDYNEGFGEEQSVNGLHSQIIPLIKHQTVILNNITKSFSDDSNYQSTKELEKENVLLPEWSNLKSDQETTHIRDCPTPDIFDFEGLQADEKQTEGANLLEEDEEDLLPTQLIPSKIIAKQTKSLIDVEKPCLEKEIEEVLTSSDKENRSPTRLEPTTDLPPAQLLEARSRNFTSGRINNSALKSSTTSSIDGSSSSKTSLNIDPDEEDDLLTQAFLQPASHTSTSTGTTSKNLLVKCFNSTLLEDKYTSKNPITLFEEIEKTPQQQTSTAVTVFKKPYNDFSAVKETSSSSEITDLDLLMCTPQVIKDNIFVGKSEDFRKDILAINNNNLFGNETDEEDDDDDKGDLIKLINVPKDSSDFDMLLPHLNTRPQRSRMSEEQKLAKEVQKEYKFNLSFGKELDEKQLKIPITKSSTLSRDERRAARDMGKEKAERKEKRKTRNKRCTPGEDDRKESKSRKGEEIPDKDQTKTGESSTSAKGKNQKHVELDTDPEKSEKATLSKNQEKPKRTRKTHNSEISKEKTSEMSTRQITSSNSGLQELPSTSKKPVRTDSKDIQYKEDDFDNIATQSVVRVTRSRTTSKQSNSQDSVTSKNSSIKSKSQIKSTNDTTANKTTERKRKADVTTEAAAAKVERKSSKSTELLTTSSLSSSAPPVAISMTMVDQEYFANLVKNSKNCWNIAKNPAESDVLVMDKAFRTFKFLLAMARGIPIVTSDYLKKINERKSKQEVEIGKYLFKDADFEKKYKFSITKSLQVAKKCKIFDGYEFLLTASILPKPEEIKAIIEASGGLVRAKTPPQPKENQKLYLVTAKEDKKEWHKYRRLNKNITIVSTEAVMSAVMRQNCECMVSFVLT